MKKPFKNPFRHHRAKNRNKPRGYSPTQIICVSFVIVIALESYAKPELKAVGFLKEEK